ncbi:MAG: hypothetical protein O2967_07485 [Proteobacteria bacterium]|nr:hypothetical protein [Pseudomonadota bacterium]
MSVEAIPIEDFHPGEVTAQRRCGTPGLWDRTRAQQLLWHAMPEVFHAGIEAAPFFLLSAAARAGGCDCSFKGGGRKWRSIGNPPRLQYSRPP